jgi:hypothetical protein
LGEDLRQVPDLVGVRLETARPFEHRVLEHAVFSQAAVTDITVARRSLRFSIRRWHRGASVLDVVAERIQLLGALYQLVETLAHDLVHLAAQDGTSQDEGSSVTAFETAVTLIVAAVASVANRSGAPEPGLVAEVDAALARPPGPPDPWTAVIDAGLCELARRHDASALTNRR